MTTDMQLSHVPVAKAGMLIHRPADIVYEAFINPEMTTKFWFTRSSGRLEMGKRIRWDWEMYGVSSLVEVKALEPGKRILIEWGVDNRPTLVEWVFVARGSEATFVNIINSGFEGDGDTVVEQAMGSAEGFGLVLAGLKAYLERGIELSLVADRYPDQRVDHLVSENSVH